MKTLLSFVKDNRPKFKTENQKLGEISVNILKYQEADVLDNLKPVLFLTIPMLTTVKELKERLFGQTSIHPRYVYDSCSCMHDMK